MTTMMCKAYKENSTKRTGDRRWRLPALLAVLLLAGGSALSAQELGLFEPVAGSPDTTALAPRPEPAQAGSSEPRFILVGTSRFGDNYRVHLRERSGSIVTVTATGQDTAAIPGHAGYTLSGIGSRNVAINHPGTAPCVAAPDRGVSCEGNSTSRLQIATFAPLQPAEPQPEPAQRGRDRRGDTANGDNGADQPQNPFAAALRAARERNPEDEAVMRAQAERFERRRVDPSDVPEGYNVVRTPFGDRVVRIREQE
jgi:hypothetical protein